MYADSFNKPYLDRVVMEVCYHYFIFVIHSHKVRTWNQQRRQRGKNRGKMSHLVFFSTWQEVPHYFWTGLKTHNTVATRRLVDVGECVRQDRSWAAVWKKKKNKICHTRGGNIYLLKAGPDLLSFCSSAMFAPLFSTRKEKVQVRDKIERKDEFQSWVCATNDAYGSIPGEQACFTFCWVTVKGRKKIKTSSCISLWTEGF